MRVTSIKVVSMGCRPAGFSVKRDTSISPYAASVSVRGMGVAVITKTSVPGPLAEIRIR